VKKPRATSQTLQASVSMLKVKVHDSTIRKRLNKCGLLWFYKLLDHGVDFVFHTLLLDFVQ